jgi:uncharacterized membrane protein
MESYDMLALAQMLTRWVHVFAAILWIGQTFLFHLMERHLVAVPSEKAVGRMWMLHGGGYYQVEKRNFAPGMPEQLVWFKWEAATTWISGAILLGLTYHAGGLMAPPEMNPGIAAGVGTGAIVFGWVIYDMLVRSPLGARPVQTARSRSIGEGTRSVHCCHGAPPFTAQLLPRPSSCADHDQ